MKRLLLSVCSALLLPIAANCQQTINLPEAGKLSTYVNAEEKYTIEELTVTGELNGSDFALLRDMAGNNSKGELTKGKLRKLDLAGVTVVAGGEKYLDTYEIALDLSSTFSDSRGLSFETIDNVMPQYAFVGCNSLREIILPASCTEIGEYAFYNGLLTIVTIPSGVQKIGDRAFYGNNHLLDFTMPGTLTSIGENAFTYCIELTKIELPAGLNEIGKNAFNNCKKITDVWSYIIVPFTITDKTFAVYDKAVLHVPEGTIEAYQSTAAWNKFQKIETFNAATGIDLPAVESPITIYNMQGVKMQPTKTCMLRSSVYISNGRKFIGR